MEGPTLLVCGLADHVVADLRSRGHEVEVATEGFRALELAERVHPQVVIARAGLPGPEVTELIRRLKLSAGRVVMILDEPDAEAAATLLCAEADGVLTGDPGPGLLVWAAFRVAEGGVVLSPEIARTMVESLTGTVFRERAWAKTLAESARQAEGLGRAKADFLGNVSHELRSPLTIIKGVASTLTASASESSQQAQLLAEVERAADKLATMVEGILTEAEIERGEVAMDFSRCDVAEVIRQSAADVASSYPEIVLDVTVPAAMPATVDARAIRGVIRQLVDNACRYSEAGATVSVKARRNEEGITVHVTDRGVGVSRGHVAAAFGQPFAPGEEILTKERAGLGLGLNLARRLLALHGGILWAEPLPGGGTRVSFTVPPEGPRPAVSLTSRRVASEAPRRIEPPQPASPDASRSA